MFRVANAIPEEHDRSCGLPVRVAAFTSDVILGLVRALFGRVDRVALLLLERGHLACSGHRSHLCCVGIVMGGDRPEISLITRLLWVAC